MPVFACLFHIKEWSIYSLWYTSKDKHSPYCADFSRSSFIIPFLCEQRNNTLVYYNKLGGPQTTHRAGSLSLFSPASYVLNGHIYRFVFVLLLVSQFLSRLCSLTSAKVVCPLFQASASPLYQCVYLFECADMNCRDDGRLVWYICLWDHPASQAMTWGVRGYIFQRLHSSQGPRAECD